MSPSLQDEFKLLREKFNAFFPQLVSEVAADEEFKHVPIAVEWMKEVMTRNVPQGKQNRGLAMISVYQQLVEVPDDSILPLVAGWVIEINQAAALMADDIMDDSTTRRGILCWYKQEDVGPSALNDSLMLENLAYFVSYKYFSDKPYFARFLKVNHDILMKTIMGQCLDTRCAFKFSLENCTQQTYEGIVKYKTSYYSFYYPVALAMVMAGITDDSMYRAVEEVTMELGYFFQVQDDFLDCYGNVEITGKVGTDIADGKCTWLLVKALDLVTVDQYKSLQTCYGSKEEEDAIAVKRIYDDLGIPAIFKTFENKTYVAIRKMINVLPEKLPKDSLLSTLHAIYKRDH